MSAPVSPSAPGYSSDGAPLAQYRAVSRAAVAALGLGIASALALASPLFVVIPLGAMVAGVIALRNIASGSGQVVGRGLAIAGICLAALFGGWGLAQHFSRQMAVADQAIRLADGWLNLVKSGKLAAAHQLTLAPSQRMNSLAGADEYYSSNAIAAEQLENFFASEPLKSFVAAGSDVAFRLDSLHSQLHERQEDAVVLKYVFERPAGPAIPLWISVVRSVDETSRAVGWQISGASAAAPR